jgi:hypothetical protein
MKTPAPFAENGINPDPSVSPAFDVRDLQQTESPNLEASLNLPNAHAPLEATTDRPGLPSGKRHARRKQRPSWAMVAGLWRVCKWLALALSNSRSICGLWASSNLNTQRLFGIARLLTKFVKPLRTPYQGRIGSNSRSVKLIAVFTRMCWHTLPRPARLGLWESPICADGSRTFPSRLFHTMRSRSKANICKLLKPQSSQVSGCHASLGLVGFRALYEIKSVSFGRAS